MRTMAFRGAVRLLTLVAIVVIAVLAAVMLATAYQNPSQSSAYSGPLPCSFTAGGETFNFSEYAATTQEMYKGLMNQTITDKTFMLFAFSRSGVYPFWMRNTYNSLDIIWLYAKSPSANNGAKQIRAGVVWIAANATPCINESECPNYIPSGQANYVVEAKAGFAAEHGLSVGQNVTLSYCANVFG